MADTDAFTLVNEVNQHGVFDDYQELSSAHLVDPQTYLTAVFRRQYPDLAVTCTSSSNPALLAFAAAGYATAELDITNESINRLRGYMAGNARYGYKEGLYESRYFAKYNYRWGNQNFILYVIAFGYSSYNFLLKEPAEGETTLSTPKVVDALIMACGRWSHPVDNDFIYVYDGYWSASKSLWQQVQKARWEDVILNEEMKKTLVDLMTKFFDSEDIYGDLGVPWKRGVIFHGPAGNGKTISIKALMHSLSVSKKLKDRTIPALYVKSAPRTYDIRSIFLQARAMAPCMLILEDIDTIVTASSRSYFFNEVDGLENNDGIFMVASTNHLDRLDPGLSSRPSRFDRKYLFPLPSEDERELYCEYWRQKLKSKPAIKYPRKLCPAIAGITADFSFAYLQEAFIATLLAIAGHRSEERIPGGGPDDGDDNEGGSLDSFELWREMKRQVKALRDDMKNSAVNSLTRAGSAPVLMSKDLPIRARDPTKQRSELPEAVIFDREGNARPLTGIREAAAKDEAVRDLPLFGEDGRMVMRRGAGMEAWGEKTEVQR
ncbi:MAG: hypothetical protein Q9226_007270 [Calogaya cf. arnoldii]